MSISLLVIILLIVFVLYRYFSLTSSFYISPDAVPDYLKKHKSILFDVRSQSERLKSRHFLSRHLPIDRLVFDLERLVPNKDQPLVFCCKRGIRSHGAVVIAKDLGYTKVSYTGNCDDIV